MKKVIIKDAEKAVNYGFSMRHIVGADDEFDLYVLQIRGRDTLHFYQNSSNIRQLDGMLLNYGNIDDKDLIAAVAELALLGIAEVKDE